MALWQIATEVRASGVKVLHFLTVFSRAVKWGIGNFIIADRNFESVAEDAEFLFVQLFLLVSDIASFTCFTEAVAFNGFGENDCGLVLVIESGFVGGKNFGRVMPATQHTGQFVIGEMIDHAVQLRILAKEIFTDKAS